MKENLSPIFIIDICGTVFRSNTTFDFIRYWFSDELWFKMMQLLCQCKVIGFLNSQIHKFFHVDIIRKYAISKLRGYTESQLLCMTEKFYDDCLANLINNETIEIIERKRMDGYRLIIVSATLDCISKEVASRLNICTQLSSELCYINGICQGKLNSDLLDSKRCYLETNNIKLDNTEIITDNYGDADIINVSTHAYLIQYKDKREKWSQYLSKETLKRCEYIRL